MLSTQVYSHLGYLRSIQISIHDSSEIILHPVDTVGVEVDVHVVRHVSLVVDGEIHHCNAIGPVQVHSLDLGMASPISPVQISVYVH